MDWAPGYRELKPSRHGLMPGVQCVWARVAGPGGIAMVLPDACVDLIWVQGYGVFVAGPDTGPAPSEMAPGAVLAGVRFGPGAGGPALGMPLSALLNARVDAADLGSSGGARLARVPGSAAPDVALRMLVDAAGTMLAERPADGLVMEAARLLGRSGTAGGAERLGGSGARVDTVAERLGVSERQLRRRCLDAVGYGPATLRRVLRFRRFVSWVDGGDGAHDGELARAAADLGYADQAHLTRECVRLAGLTPAALRAARRPP
jgi:AraC-like DNA-binding protein